MLKNIYDHKKKREFQEGIVQLYDKIWIYGFHLGKSEKEFLKNKFKVNPEYLENINQHKIPELLSKEPMTFIVPDFILEKDKIIQNNILFVVGDKFILTLMPNNIKEYESLFKTITDVNPFNIVQNLFMKSVQTNYDVLDNIELQIRKTHRRRGNLDKVHALRKNLITMEGVLRKTNHFLKHNFPFNLIADQKEFLQDVQIEFTQQMNIIEEYHTQLDKFEPRKEKFNFGFIPVLIIDFIILVLMLGIIALVFIFPEILFEYIGINLPEDIVIRLLTVGILVSVLAFPLFFLHMGDEDV